MSPGREAGLVMAARTEEGRPVASSAAMLEGGLMAEASSAERTEILEYAEGF